MSKRREPIATAADTAHLVAENAARAATAPSQDGLLRRAVGALEEAKRGLEEYDLHILDCRECRQHALKAPRLALAEVRAALKSMPDEYKR